MRPQDFLLLANATEEVADVLEKLLTEHPDVFNSLDIRYPLMDELSGYSGMLREHAQKVDPVNASVQNDLLRALKRWEQFARDNQWNQEDCTFLAETRAAIAKADHGKAAPAPVAPAPTTPPTKNQGQIAEQAFSDYDFGDGVMVTDSSGWFYASDEHERTRKVYVETEAEDDGPAPSWKLTFTVRFDPTTGALAEAYAIDSKGQIWGSLPAKDNQKETTPQSAVEAQVAKTHPDFNAEDVRAVASLQSALLASQQQSAARPPDQDTPAHETDCYVIVKGEASDDEDKDVPGAYLVQLELSRPVSAPGGVQHTFNEADHAEMATAVLNEFHAQQGISVLDDFEISVHLFGGDTIEETKEERDTGLVLNADFCGKVSEEELPFDLPATQHKDSGAQPGM